MKADRDNEIYLYLNEGGFTPGTYRHLTIRLSDDDESEVPKAPNVVPPSLPPKTPKPNPS